MKTVLVITKSWEPIKEYDFIFPLSSGDTVEVSGIEYRVSSLLLEVDKDRLLVLLNV